MSETTLNLVHASKSRGGILFRRTTTTFTTANDVSLGGSCFNRKRGRIVLGFGRSPPAAAYHRCRIVVTRQTANRRWAISRRDGIAPQLQFSKRTSTLDLIDLLSSTSRAHLLG